MSIKNLFTTATTSTTQAITGIVHLGKPIGAVSEWLAEWGESINSDEAKELRKLERDWDIKQRKILLMEQKDEIDVVELKALVQRVKAIDTELDNI